MKTTHRLFALVLALVMAMALSVTAFAAENDDSGTIEIKNTVSGETYTIYQIAVLESYDIESSNYAYKAADAWSAWLSSSVCTWVTVTNGYVTWNEGADVSTFVAAALAYAQTNSITATNSTTASGTSVIFSDLNLGWYLVDSSLGALCSLDTTNPDAEVNDKNDEPSITKQVQEDSTGEYGGSATIDVTDTIYYQLTVTVGTGVDGDYTITDVLPSGFTADTSSVSISGWTLNDDYTVTTESGNMVITLKAAKLATVNSVTIEYTATVDKTTTLTADTTYTNTVTLSYKNQTYTDTASVVTYDFGTNVNGNPTLVKIDGATADGDAPTALKGVKFVLSKTTSTGTMYATFNNGYLTGWISNKDDATELETDSNGGIYAYGLDADTYILTETETLPGYNLLDDTITVIIDEEGTVTYKYTSSNEEAGESITVENNSGSLLPTTGGMGTTVIYIVGALLVIGAGIVLVVRRRMSAE